MSPGWWLVERARDICHVRRELGGLQLRPRHAVLVKTGGVLQAGILPGWTTIRAGKTLRIQNADGLLQFIPHHANRSHEIGITRHDDGAFVFVSETIEQQMRGKVHI